MAFTTPKNAPRSRRALAAAVLTLILAAAPLVTFYKGQENTLLNNRQWFVFKLKLDTEVMGAKSYLNGPQALAGNHLNLGAWHGHQEVLLREKLRPKRIAFDFLLEDGAYLAAEFDRAYTKSFNAFRLSANPLFSNAALHVDHDGEFLEKTPIEPAAITADTWHRAVIDFVEGEARLQVDGTEWARIPFEPRDPAWIGFRGGSAPAAVDNVVVEDRSRGTLIHERFDNRWELARAMWRPILLGALLAGLAALVLRFFHKTWRDTLWTLTAVHLSVAAATITLAGYRIMVSSRHYPAETAALQRTEDAWVQERFESINSEIQRQHAIDAAPGVLRVLFVGSSQTQGSGAAEIDDIFVNRIAAALADPARDLPPVECINTAIPGEISRYLLRHYEQHWIHYAPDLVVINLSVNDAMHNDLAENLRAFVARNRSAGIRTLFVLEANALEEHPDELFTHTAMRAVGEELAIPVIDSRGYLNAHYDDGFLWWDVVHPTSYGHALIAEALVPPITDALREIAARDADAE